LLSYLCERDALPTELYPQKKGKLSWRNDFSASDSENSELPELLLSLSRRENEAAKLAAFEFSWRSGVIEYVLFGRVAGPVRLDTGTLVTLPAARTRPNFDDRSSLSHRIS